MDLKQLKSAIKQLAEEKKIDEEVLFETVESVFAAAYKKGYAKNSQVIHSKFNRENGELSFFQVKEALSDENILAPEEERVDENDKRVFFNPERHIKLEDAKLVQANIESGEKIFFPLNAKSEFSRIAAQSAAQMLAKSLREAEKDLVMKNLKGKEGEVVSGVVHRFERGAIFVTIKNTIAKIPYEEKIPGERFREGESVRALIKYIDEKSRGGNLVTLSRASTDFIIKLFVSNSPELADGKIKIEKIVRIPGQRTKIAVSTEDETIDPVGSLVGPRGVRVLAVRGELNGGREYIDIIEKTPEMSLFVEEALSPLKISSVTHDNNTNKATVTVLDEDIASIFERGGQNISLASELTQVDLDIKNMSDELLITVKEGILEKHVDETEFVQPREERYRDTKETNQTTEGDKTKDADQSPEKEKDNTANPENTEENKGDTEKEADKA